MLARHDVAGHGTKRDRELVEVVDLRRPQRLARDDHVDDLALHEPDGQLELAVVETRLLIDEKRIVVALAPERLQLARRDVQERRLPLEAVDEVLEVRDAHAGDVESADDGADARARDVVDRHSQLLERLQHADVRAAARAAAGQHETDLRSRARRTDRRLRRLRERGSGRRARHCERDGKPQALSEASSHDAVPRSARFAWGCMMPERPGGDPVAASTIMRAR
jgi:hypothetical protein